MDILLYPPLPDNDDWNYGLGNYTDLGDGYFWDEDNNEILYDSDGDGKPDSVWIPPVDIMPDTPGGTGQPEQPGVPGGTGGETVPPIGPGEPFEPGEGTDPVFPVDPDPIPDVCPLCGSIGCGGSCVGDLPQPTPPTEPGEPIGPDTTMIAKKLFRNSKMIESNWIIVNEKILQITNTCIGDKLIKELLGVLDGKTLKLDFINEGDSKFDPGFGGIKLRTNAESSYLFHEMFHALQSYTEQETWNGANLNLEFEAHFAQQIFIEQMSENEWKLWKERTKFDSRWKAVRDLKNYIDNHGRPLPGITENDLQDEFMKHTIDGFRRVGYDNLDYSWLSSRKGSKNLSNIQKITIDCNK